MKRQRAQEVREEKEKNRKVMAKEWLSNLYNTVNISYVCFYIIYCIQKSNKPRKPRTSTSRHVVASSAGEAIERMLVERRLSSKINYEVLKDLADGFATNDNSVATPSSSSTVETGTPVEGDNGSLPPISRTPVSRGRLPSLSARKRTFSSLEVTHTPDSK